MRPRALALSLAGCAAVLGGSIEVGHAVAPPAEQLSAAAPSAGSAAPSAAGSAAPSAAGSAAPSAGASPSHPVTANGSGTYAGATAQTPFGPMQVQIVVANGRITDVKTLQVTDMGGRSVMISQYATPILRQEALTAQSARIDSVSGATYTSEGYAASLQSAIDKAGLKG